MKRHVNYELEPADLEAMVEGHSLDLDVEDADSVSISTDAHPMPLGQAGGFRFVRGRELVADSGEEPEATDQEVTDSVEGKSA